jgi:hypothetical protein
MLTIEIKVNGNIVAIISAANVTSLLAGDATGEHVYQAQIVEFRKFTGDLLDGIPRHGAFMAKHVRDEGIMKLAAILCHEAWDSGRIIEDKDA